MALAAALGLLGMGKMLCLGGSASPPVYLLLTGTSGQQLSWQSIIGARYTVQASTDLVRWLDVDVVTATTATTVWPDPFPRPSTKGFYRVILPQPQVRRVEPSVVQSGAATTVYFLGECFASGGAIWIDGVQQAPGTLVYDSATQLHAALTLTAGEHTVVIKDASGATLAGGALFVLASASGLKIEVPPVEMPPAFWKAARLAPLDSTAVPEFAQLDPAVGQDSQSDRSSRVKVGLDDFSVTKAFDKSSGGLAIAILDGRTLEPFLIRDGSETKVSWRSRKVVQDPPKPKGPPIDNILPTDNGLPLIQLPIRSFIAQDDCGPVPAPLPPFPSPPMPAAPNAWTGGDPTGPIILPPGFLDTNAPAMPWRGDVPLDPGNCSFGGSTGVQVTPAGEVMFTCADLALPGVGLDLVWARNYRSRLGADSAMGMGWDFSYNIRARKDSPTQVTVFDGNGRADVFRQQASGAFECAERFESGALSGGGTVFTLTFPDGGKWEFGAFGALPGPANLARIVTIRDRNDNTITCTYDLGTGRLLTVADAHGRSLTIAYDGAGWIQSVTDSTGRSVTYTHDAAGDLTLVRSPPVVGTPHGNDFPLGKTIAFTYSSGTGDPARDHNLLTITDGLAQTPVAFTYFPEPLPANVEYDRLERARIGAVGQDVVFRPERLTPAPSNRFAVLKNYVNDRNGHLTEIESDAMNRPVRVRSLTGACVPGVAVTAVTNRPGAPLRPGDPPHFQWDTDWNSSSCWIRVTQPRGNTIERLYLPDLRLEGTVPAPQKARLLMQRQRTDAPGVYDQDEIMTGIVYDERFGADRGRCFPTQIIDERGYATHFTYDTRANLTSVKRARVTASPAAPTTNTMAVADCTYNTAGQLTSILGPHNGTQRRLDTFAYIAAGPQKGWLASAKRDDGGFNITTQFEYNNAGATTRIIDPRGNDTLITRNALNQAVRIEGPLVALATPRRQRATIYFDANNRVTQMDTLNFDEAGVIAANAELTTTIARDVLNLPVLVTEEIDAVTTRSTQFIYDAERNCTQVLLPMAVAALQPANRVAIAYDERNLPYTVTYAPGAPEQSTTRYDYDANANCTVITQGTEGAQPRTWTMTYGPLVGSALGYSTAPLAWPYDSEWFAHQPPDPRSLHNLQFPAFRKTNSPASIWRDAGDLEFSTGGWREKNANSGSWSNSNQRWPSTLIDPSGNELRLYRDPAGNPVLMMFKGELNDVPGGAGNVTLYQTTRINDFANRPTTMSESHFALMGGAPIGDGSRTTSMTWTDAGAPSSVTNDLSCGITIQYDGFGRRKTVTDTKGNTLELGYDLGCNVVQLKLTDISDLGFLSQQFVCACSYDNANRRSSVTDNVGNSTTFAYDSRGNLKKLVNPRGNAVLHVFDGLSRLLKTIRDADGSLSETAPDAVTQTAHDLDSRVTSRTDDNGNVTQYTHDPLNRLKLITHADGTTLAATYDVHHNVTQSTDANGTVVNCFFDLNDRVVAKNIIPGAGVAGTTVSETFSYDGASHLTGGTSNGTVAHSFARTHDSFGNLLTESQDGVPTVVSTYDALGNRLAIAYPGGRVVTTTFDALNRASVITDTSGAVATLKYIGPDRVERIDYGNGTRCDLTWSGIDGVPNAPGDFGWRRVARARHTHIASATVIDDRTFAWDRNQNKTQRKDLRPGGPQLTHDYTYDQLDRLVATQVNAPGPVLARQTNYALDGAANRINVAGPNTPNPGAYVMSAVNPPADAQMNQYTNSPLGPHLYDAGGSQTGLAGAVFVYDYRRNLVAVTGIATPVSYEYDSLGRCVKKVAGPVTTTYAYTGSTSIAETPSAGPATDFVCSNIPCEIIAESDRGRFIALRGGVMNAWLHTDDIGNTMALSDAAGAVIEFIEYEDYGQPRFFNAVGGSVPSSVTGNPWLFRVMRYEHETGLYGTTYFDGYETGSDVHASAIPGRFDGNAENTRALWTDPRTGQALQRGGHGEAGSRHFHGANPWSP